MRVVDAFTWLFDTPFWAEPGFARPFHAAPQVRERTQIRDECDIASLNDRRRVSRKQNDPAARESAAAEKAVDAKEAPFAGLKGAVPAEANSAVASCAKAPQGPQQDSPGQGNASLASVDAALGASGIG
jgi:hypothetical protein